MRALRNGLLWVSLLLAVSACQGVKYRALEKFGVEKRDILVDRVEEARDSQSAAREQFTSALDQFRSLVAIEGGELDETYTRLHSEYERSRDRAKAVSDRVEAVERVAGDLFDEWEKELNDYENPELRKDSERLLRDTRRRYSTLIGAMRGAEESMHPVLEVFEDQVLVLKHNLNAQAIGSLKRELASIEQQTARLIADMNRAIAEADRFIQNMR